MDAPSIVIPARPRKLAGFDIERILPSRLRRTVGPFIFVDRMGPVDLAPGQGNDILPHPHIGLATVTYLFEGAFVHRDSLGNHQVIHPGAVNWMTAGRGIAHSERMPKDVRAQGGLLNGLQTWVALPRADELTAPTFAHHPAATLPEFTAGDATVRLLIGRAFDHESPVAVFAPTTYLHVTLPAGGTFAWKTGQQELGVLPLQGSLRVNDTDAEISSLVVFEPGHSLRVEAQTQASFMLLGGEPLDGPRLIWWNYVASSRDRIQEAHDLWARQGFTRIPGDDREFTPQPEGPIPMLR